MFTTASHTLFLKAEIIIWPETSEAYFSEKIEIDSSAIISDYENRLIVGEIFEIEKEESRSFFSSGKEGKGKKAEGTLKVYNNYSSSPQPLVANTRFISADGKLFYSTERITIPGRREEKGKTVPGEIEVLIRAAEEGKEYNIERTSKFSIPGLQGTALYTSIYAENPEPISGGYSGELHLITEQDIKDAKNVLLSDLSEKARTELEEKILSGFVIEKELIEEEILEESFSPGIGENSELFQYSMKINLRIISFKKSDFEKIIEVYLNEVPYNQEKNEEIFPKKEIFKESLEFDFRPEIINFRGGRAVLNVDSSILVYSGINERAFKKSLARKKLEEVETIMKNYSEIEKFELKYRPFWIKAMPNENKIKITLRIES